MTANFNEWAKKYNEMGLRKNEGDYTGEDGLLYCGVCHEPKQKIVEGVPYPINRSCACRRKKLEERDAREKAEQIGAARQACFRDFGERGIERAGRMRFENDRFNDEAAQICRKYAAKFDDMLRENTGLLLYGEVGRGKSFLAACICNSVIENGHTAAFFPNFGEIARNAISVEGEEREESKSRLLRPDLIVIDDFGIERSTDFMDEAIQTALNIRYNANKPIIFTTNLTPDDFKNPQDMKERRVFDRIFELCRFVEVTGADKRIIEHNEREERFKQDGEADE